MQEAAGDVALEQPLAVLGEHRHVPDRRVHREADEPAEQHVVGQLLHQLPFRAHRVEGLQEQGPQQLLRGDRGPPRRRVEPFEVRREAGQRRVHQRPDGPQRVVLRHHRVRAQVAEQRPRLLVRSAHPSSPPQPSGERITPRRRREPNFRSLLIGAAILDLPDDARGRRHRLLQLAPRGVLLCPPPIRCVEQEQEVVGNRPWTGTRGRWSGLRPSVTGWRGVEGGPSWVRSRGRSGRRPWRPWPGSSFPHACSRGTVPASSALARLARSSAGSRPGAAFPPSVASELVGRGAASAGPGPGTRPRRARGT